MTFDTTLRQKRAMAALLRGETVRESAHRAGVSERTIYRWLQRKEFRDTFNMALDALLELEDAFEGMASADVAPLTRDQRDRLRRRLFYGFATCPKWPVVQDTTSSSRTRRFPADGHTGQPAPMRSKSNGALGSGPATTGAPSE